MGEEPELSPAFTVFLSGCNLRCLFCSDGEVVEDPNLGVLAEPASIAERVAARPDLRCVEFVGGLPDPSLLWIARCAEGLPKGLPLALNTNGWFTPEALDAMVGWVDTLIVDLKFGPGPCAAELAGASDYWGVVTANLLRAAGRFKLFVRHLVLPGHLACCTRPVLRWLGEALPDTRVNLMLGYRPLHHAASRVDALGYTLSSAEAQAVLALPELASLSRLSVDGRQSW